MEQRSKLPVENSRTVIGQSASGSAKPNQFALHGVGLCVCGWTVRFIIVQCKWQAPYNNINCWPHSLWNHLEAKPGKVHVSRLLRNQLATKLSHHQGFWMLNPLLNSTFKKPEGENREIQEPADMNLCFFSSTLIGRLFVSVTN